MIDPAGPLWFGRAWHKLRSMTMVWEWSHSSDAYSAVRTNIAGLDRDTLETIWAEWIACSPRGLCAQSADNREFCSRRFHLAKIRAARRTTESIANDIWEWTQELATCENGGNEAHCCPCGCCPHMVPFHVPCDICHDAEMEYEGDGLYTCPDCGAHKSDIAY